MSNVVIIIPARHASTRYPGKPLAGLRGATGISKTLIQRTWEAAQTVAGAPACFVATDDLRIADAVHDFGGQVLMTSEACRNGTERCAEAIQGLDPRPDIVVNLQGDAPLTPPWFIEALIATMQDNADVQVATPVLRCDTHALEGFLADRAAGRVGATTAVFDRNGRALYFSKEVLPYTDGQLLKDGVCPVFHHVGVYAYRPRPLLNYPNLVPGPLEELEGLEQLRFMENGLPVQCVTVEARGAKFWELNNPQDVPRIEAVLSEQGTP